MTDTIDDNLLVVENKKKIPVDDIEGTNYSPAALGGGAYRVNETVQAEADSGVVATGTTFISTLTFNVKPPIITNPQPMFSIYVDNDENSTWLWPAGSNLTSSNRPRVNWGMNEALSNPAEGTYVYSFAIKNESGSNQNYYLKVRMLLPNVLG